MFSHPIVTSTAATYETIKLPLTGSTPNGNYTTNNYSYASSTFSAVVNAATIATLSESSGYYYAAPVVASVVPMEEASSAVSGGILPTNSAVAVAHPPLLDAASLSNAAEITPQTFLTKDIGMAKTEDEENSSAFPPSLPAYDAPVEKIKGRPIKRVRVLLEGEQLAFREVEETDIVRARQEAELKRKEAPRMESTPVAVAVSRSRKTDTRTRTRTSHRTAAKNMQSDAKSNEVKRENLYFFQMANKLLRDNRANYNVHQNIGYFVTHFNNNEIQWPRINRPDDTFMMSISAYTSGCVIECKTSNEKTFLTLTIDNANRKNPTISEKKTPTAQWSNAEIDDIVFTLTPFFQLKPKVVNAPLDWMDEKEFDVNLKKFENAGVNQRIKGFLGDAAYIKTEYVFWVDRKDLPEGSCLKFIFKNDYYESTCLKEEALLKIHYPNMPFVNHLKYYSLKVIEWKNNLEQDFDGQILDILLTFDALVGEIRHVNKKGVLSGDKILNLFLLLDSFLKIQTTYLYDDSHLTHEDGTQIPLRVTRVLAQGRTWYSEHLGMKVFHCEKIDTDINGIWSQNAEEYEKAVNQLYAESPSLDRVMEESKIEDELASKASPSTRVPSKVDALTCLMKQFPQASTLRQLALEVEKYGKEKAKANPPGSPLDLSMARRLSILSAAPCAKTNTRDYAKALNALEGPRIFVRRRAEIKDTAADAGPAPTYSTSSSQRPR